MISTSETMRTLRKLTTRFTFLMKIKIPVKEFRICLSEQLEKFCKEQSLPNWCCDDLLHKDASDDLYLSKDQRQWLIDFQIAWCAVTDDEPM